MQLVEQHIIKRNHKFYKEIDDVAYKSKNLYNAALYAIRQHFFKTKKYLNYYTLQKEFQNTKQNDYIALPANVAQQTMQMVNKNFISFFNGLKSYKKNSEKFKSIPKIPKYLHKTNGRYLVTYTKRVISKKYLNKKHVIKLTNLNIEIPTQLSYKQIQQVRIVCKLNQYVIEIIYNANELPLKPNNDNYASIDLGVDNLAAVTFNNSKSFIINGKPIKSINHYYNKKKVLYQNRQKYDNRNICKNKIRILGNKRANKIQNYFHKASRLIVNQLVSKNVNTLIIGHSNLWKQDINNGAKNNQNFVQIPFNKLIQMLQYKCRFEGINVIIQEESYTSKASFIDNDFIPVYNAKNNQKYQFSGYRKTRGLYKSKIQNKYINADINGSLNIMRKAVPNVKFTNGIQVCGSPNIINIKENKFLYF